MPLTNGAEPAVGRRRPDAIFLGILAAALLLRLDLAVRQPYIHDEENTAIPLSKTISLTPGNLRLPIRGENHGALPAYVVKASGAIFGTTPLGYRSAHLLLGLCTVVLIYLLTRQWYGASAARWAAALMAFNEYYLTISSRATAHVPHLFLVTAAVYAFSRFLAAQRPVYLYMAGAAVGLAFYCKEHAALLLPVFLLALLLPRYRHWLRGPHAYLACALFVVVIGPDLLFNLVTDPGAARVTYGGQTRGQATYAAHLQRIGGIGFSPYPLMFYGRTAVMSVHQRITGSELRDETAEYQAMNPAIGMLLLGAALVTTFRAAGRDQFRTFLLFLLWGIFGFFTLIKRGNPPFRLDPVSWIWVEVTIVPAVILAGARLARATGMLRIAVWAFAGGALLYASAPSTVIAGGLREVEYAFGSASHTAQYVAAATVTAVRSHPLRALGIVAAAGAAAGLLLAFGRGWFGRGGQSQRRSEGVSPP